MTQVLIKYENIALTTTTIHRVRYHLYLLFLVRLGGYIVNLWLLFLQTHRETDRFFAVSEFQLAQTDRDQFHYRRAAFSSHLKAKVGNILAKTAAFGNFSSINLVSIFRCSSPPRNPVYARRVDPSTLVYFFSLSPHRHSYVGLLFNSCFITS